jgi:hypothetical protein
VPVCCQGIHINDISTENFAARIKNSAVSGQADLWANYIFLRISLAVIPTSLCLFYLHSIIQSPSYGQKMMEFESAAPGAVDVEVRRRYFSTD